MKSIKPRSQRREMYNAPLHKRRKWVSSHLEENLLIKYDRRSMPVIKGDTVRVMRGSFKGHENKVARVNLKKGYLEIEGITMIKADGKKIAKPIHPSNVMITKLNLTDKWRRRKLEKGLSEETKKEIEKEAEEQIEEMKEEELRRKAEEEAVHAVEEIEEEKTEEKTVEEPVKEEPKPTEEKPKKKKPTPKKEEKKTDKSKSDKSKSEKKKTPAKSKKKEEVKK